ncbi:conserved hypothetical protein [Neospora caninum Liverpool]|uniref:Uncharacterized protein n=1 Tax=Neospora caninum (strain Liverpool) TaxID=572307 RepID=F0VN58_NEOCL|nr:conserved hypothetical protein [Neospora caninum Liverpool]CBZ55154.1 conserved hypothetical protein [Neospora caninum Liverpool]|eukprot:XP_003885182.1 conserved hypothetical protein [Neospora caninum Liverpool]
MAPRRKPSSVARKSTPPRGGRTELSRGDSSSQASSPRRSSPRLSSSLSPSPRSSAAAKERGRQRGSRVREEASLETDREAKVEKAKANQKERQKRDSAPPSTAVASQRGVHTADRGCPDSRTSAKQRRQPVRSSSSDENYQESEEEEEEEGMSDRMRNGREVKKAPADASPSFQRPRRSDSASPDENTAPSSRRFSSEDRFPPPYPLHSSTARETKRKPSSASDPTVRISARAPPRAGSAREGSLPSKEGKKEKTASSPSASRQASRDSVSRSSETLSKAPTSGDRAPTAPLPEIHEAFAKSQTDSFALPQAPFSPPSSVVTARRQADQLVPSWVRHYLSVYSRFTARELSLTAALAGVRGLLHEAADVALSEGGKERDETEGKKEETRRREDGWRDETAVTPERLLEVVFRQCLHLSLTLPKLPEREGGRLCAFFYRTLAKLDEAISEARRKRERRHGPKSEEGTAAEEGTKKTSDAQERRAESARLEDARVLGEEAEDGGKVEGKTRTPEDEALRYRYVEALWCRLLPQLLCRSRAARVGVCCFLLQLVGWGCGTGIEVAESIQKMHRQILLQLLGKSKEAAVRRMALLLLEHFQTPLPSCAVWRAFMGHLTDEAPAVRRAAVCRILLPLPHSPESPHAPATLEFAAAVSQLVTRRACDASADVRAAVYRRLAHNDASFSVEQKSFLVMTGLNDKAKGVREACSRMLRRWLQLRHSTAPGNPPREDARDRVSSGEAGEAAEGDRAEVDGEQLRQRDAGAGDDAGLDGGGVHAWEGRTKREEAERPPHERLEEERERDEMATFTAFCESPLHRLVDELMDNMPFNETAIEVLVKEVLLHWPQDCRLDLLRRIQRNGKNLSKLTASGLLILRVYMQTLASEEDRASLDVPDLHRLLLQLLAACRHHEEEQKNAAASQAKAVGCKDPVASAQVESQLQGTEEHLLTLNVCLRQLLLLACFVDIAEQQQARLLDDACEQILLKVPLVDCARLLAFNIDPLETRVTPLSPGFGDSGPTHASGFLASSIGNALWPVCCEDANLATALWSNTEEVDPLTVPVQAYAMLPLQQQHSALLDELAGLQQKSRGLFEVANSLRNSAADKNGETQQTAGKGRPGGEEGGEPMAHAVQQQITRTQKQFQRTAGLALVLNNELHARWFRVSCILDAFFARSSSNGSVDPALSDIPSSILLPALEFYCNEADAFSFCVASCCCEVCCAASSTPASLTGDKRSGDASARRDGEEAEEGQSLKCWRERDQRLQEAALGIRCKSPLHSDLCEVLVTKSLGCFCLLSTRHHEVAKQLKAYHVSLLASLGELQSTSACLQQSLNHQQALLVEEREAEERLSRRERRLLLLLREEEEREERAPREGRLAKTRDKKKGKSREEREVDIESARQGVDEATAATKHVAEECRKIAAQIQEAESAFTSHMLRCELYVCFLGDLLLSHPTLLQSEVAKQSVLLPSPENANSSSSLLNLLWQIATGEEASTKQLQSMALAVLLKLLVLPLAEDEEGREASGDRLENASLQKGADALLTHLQRVVGDRLRVLLEVVYLQPTLESGSREVMNYVHSASVWGYSADTKLLCFTILQCFASPLLPPAAARTAFGAFFGACRHLATHGLRGVFSLHFTVHQESERRENRLSSSEPVCEDALAAFVEERVKSGAGEWTETQILPPLLKMARDMKKLFLFAFRGVRSVCFAFALASLSSAEKKSTARRETSADETDPEREQSQEKEEKDGEDREEREEREGTEVAKEYVTRYLELLIVLLLVADEYIRPLLLLQPNLRFFDVVAFAVSGWVDGSAETGIPRGDKGQREREKEKEKESQLRSLVDIHAACDAPGCLTLLVVVHHLLRELVATVSASAPASAQPSAVASHRLATKVLSESLEKLTFTLFSLVSRHADGQLSAFLREDRQEGEPRENLQEQTEIQKTVEHLLQRKSCVDLAQRMKESHRYAVQEQIAEENAVFASPFLTFPFASLDVHQTASKLQEALQERQRRVEERERRLEEDRDACESSEEEIEESPPARRTMAPRKCKQEPVWPQAAHPRDRRQREEESDFESCESHSGDEDDLEEPSSEESSEDEASSTRKKKTSRAQSRKSTKRAELRGMSDRGESEERRSAAGRRVKLERM